MILLFFIAILTYFLFLCFHIQNTGWIEMLVYPFLANNNFPLYKDLIDVHVPLLVWFLQFITNLFGYKPELLVYLTIIVAFINTFLIFTTVRSITKEKK